MDKNSEYSFTIFTPCYNSAGFIGRVFSSLDKQTYRNFEWYVINDASTDNTHELIEDYIKELDFSATYINNDKNLGLLKNLNVAIENASGDFFIFAGHDDEILPHALEKFNSILNEFNSPEISAIYGLAEDQNGKLVGKKYPLDFQVSDYWTQFFTLGNEKDKFQCYKTIYLREFGPIDTSKEKGQLSPWLWGKLGGKYKAIFINDIMRIYYTNVTTSITNTGNRNQNPERIFNYYTTWVNEFQYYIKGNFKRRLRGIGGYVSYGLLSNKGFIEIIKPINRIENRLLVMFFFPIAKIYNVIKS